MKPKPRRKTYCWVCQSPFDDYLEVSILLTKHIESSDHSIGIKFSRFNNDILELIEQYGVPPVEFPKEESLDTY